MSDISTVCRQFADILGGDASVKHGVCMVERRRPAVEVQLAGRISRSGIMMHAMWSFEGMDAQGNALNLGETALLEGEVYPFTWSLQRDGIMLSALHNHWLTERPRVIYAHYLSVEPPLAFAAKAAKAYGQLNSI